ncbi:MAG: class I SAM-dependent methyltransferase [Methylocella sp.]
MKFMTSKTSVRGENSASSLLSLPTVAFAVEEQAERLFSLDRSFNLSIEWEGDPNASSESSALWHSFREALASRSRLPKEVLKMRGMSGQKYRMLINNLVASIALPRYLEIGSWLGSTACSAISGNALGIVCIDNWSEFEGPKDEFRRNIASVIHAGAEFRLIESDFRAVDFTALGSPFNLYMFDGPHAYADQYEGICIAAPALAQSYVQVVDDWNWPEVREATWDAVRDTQIDVLFKIEVRTTQDGTQPVLRHQYSDWHNGYFIAVCRRR